MDFTPDEYGTIEITVEGWKLISYSSTATGDPHVYGEEQSESRTCSQDFEIGSDGVVSVDVTQGENGRGFDSGYPCIRYIPMSVLKVAFELWEFRKGA